MRFQAPLMLLGLALVPLALWLYAASEGRARRARAAFSRPSVSASVVRRQAGWRRHGAPLLYAFALAALVVALARPQVTVAVPVEQATVLLVTDHSGSMQAADVKPSRLEAARGAAERFLDKVPRQVRVGAIAFNHAARLVAPPTTDREHVRRALAALRPSGGTATGDAVTLAVRVVAKPARAGVRRPPAAIVLLSDGKSVRGRDPAAAARDARQAGVPVYTVALGTDAGTIVVQRASGAAETRRVPPDPRSLRRIAQLSGGRSFAVGNAGELRAVYERLGSQVATRRQRREVTAAAAGGALLLVLAAAGLSLRWYGRIP
jgi:Ca-activated chloride channel homolog